MRDVRHRFGQQGRMLPYFFGFFYLRVRYQRADLQDFFFDDYLFQRGQRRDINQDLRRGEPHVERGNEALAAGQDARAFSMALQQSEYLCQGTRLCISKRGRLQCLSSSSIYYAPRPALQDGPFHEAVSWNGYEYIARRRARARPGR